MSPFSYRPSNPEDKDWADNPISNGLAWASDTFVPQWCATAGHWTTRLAEYLFTDCPCCLLWRGIVVGALANFVIFLVFVLTFV